MSHLYHTSSTSSRSFDADERVARRFYAAYLRGVRRWLDDAGRVIEVVQILEGDRVSLLRARVDDGGEYMFTTMSSRRWTPMELA